MWCTLRIYSSKQVVDVDVVVYYVYSNVNMR